MAKQITQLKGMKAVMERLNAEILKIKGRSLEGLIQAVILMRRDMEYTAPSIPIDTGNLRASWFVVTVKGIEKGRSPDFKGDDANELRAKHSSFVGEMKALASATKEPVVIMGFSANYAVFVHEMVGATFRQPKKGAARAPTGAKFFEEALNRNEKLMLQTIRDYAYIR